MSEDRDPDFLRHMIRREFEARGVQAVPYSKMSENGDVFLRHFLLLNVPYTSIYGRTARSPFVYRRFAESSDIRIITSYQQESGSVDEKFPYMFLNARDAMREPEVWLVVDGEGAKPEGIDWLRSEAAKVTHKKICVFNFIEARRAIKAVTSGNYRDAAE